MKPILTSPLVLALTVVVAPTVPDHHLHVGGPTAAEVITGCDRNLPVPHVVKLGELIQENGTLSEYFDRNDDGRMDIEARSIVTAIRREDDGTITVEHRDPPFQYVVDLDFDGAPDLVYHDIHGRGDCEDIHLYLDLRDPALKGQEHNTPSEGRT